MTGIFASIAWPMTAVRAARSLGATISRSGFCRMKVSTCATCLLLSCCASEMTSFTSGCCANSFVISAFCAARYGSALFAWLNATKNCFLPPALPHAAAAGSSEHAADYRESRLFSPISVPRCTATASTMITALIIISTLLSTLFSRSILVRTPMISVPTMVPGDRALAAGEARAADHHRGDGVEFVGDAGVRIALVILGRVEHAGEAREQAGERVDPDLGRADRQAGVLGAPSRYRRSRARAGRRRCAPAAPRNARPRSAYEPITTAFSRKIAANRAATSCPKPISMFSLFGEPFRQAAHADHGGQRDDERLDPQRRDHDAVERAGQRASRTPRHRHRM